MDLRQLPTAKYREPEVLKRPRDDTTDAIISAVLGDEQALKKAKKAASDLNLGQAVSKQKGKTLVELEHEEGGPVKESMVGTARVKRTINRKEAAASALDDTEFGTLENLGQAEEDIPGDEDQQQDEGEVPLEPFNLKQEREEGHFDEDGAYIEAKRDADEVADAWLDSVEVKPVSQAVRQRVQERARMMAEADTAAPLNDQEMGGMKGEMAALMQPGETVVRALKRLGGDKGRKGPVPKRGKQQQQQADAMQDDQGTRAGDAQAFGRLTELADALLNAGEFDIYSSSRELLAREAAAYGAPTIAQQPKQEGEKDMFAEDEDDMFGDADQPAAAAAPATNGGEAPLEQPTPAGITQAVQPPGPAPRADHGHAAPEAGPGTSAAEEVDYASWPIKELRRFLTERGQDTSNIVEKGDLVARVREAAAQGPDGGVPEAPAGYAFDPTSGYYFSTEAGMYWDPSTGAFCQASTGQWYTWDDSSQQFVAFPPAC